MKRVPLYILGGGRNSRFGSDKARAEVAGVPLVRRIAAALSPVALGVTVVAERADKYADLGLRTIADHQPGLGPMGGLATALADLSAQGGDWLLLTSCDLLEAKPAWAGLLLDRAQLPARAVAFRGERWEPLFALYHASAGTTVDAHLEDGVRAMWRLLETLQAVAVPRPDDWPLVVQANTPDELDRYRTTAAHPAPDSETP